MEERKQGISRRDFVRHVGLGVAALAAATNPAARSLAAVSTIKNGVGYRTLGRTGLEISEVGLGAGSIGTSGANLIRAALSQGINFIETSSNYRSSQVETAIGQVVSAMGMRDRVCLLTKAGNLAMGRMLNAPAAEIEKAVREELEGSLKRLHTDYIDVYLCPYQAHSPQEAALPTLREVLEKVRKEGKIRFTGLSTHNDYANVCMEAIKGGFFDVIMLPVNFSTLIPHIGDTVVKAKDEVKNAGRGGQTRRRGEERPIIDVRAVLNAAQEKKIGVIAMKGAQEGFLPPFIHERLKGEFAADTKLSFHQFAYRFVLDQPQVSTVSIRMANMLHLDEGIALSQKTLKG